MARDWETTSTLADLQARMAACGENIAPIPLAMSMEQRGAKTVWMVDVHVRVKRKTEIEISTEGHSLSDALRRAYIGLGIEVARRFGGDTRSNEVLGFSY